MTSSVGKAQILCVDDDPRFLTSMVDAFRSLGYRAQGAESPEAALQQFSSASFDFDVVVTDMTFGKQQRGQELMLELFRLRELRGFDPAPEVICLTGNELNFSPSLINDLNERGGEYVRKGSTQYIDMTIAAIERLSRLRGTGPSFVITHSLSGDYSWQKHDFQCLAGEAVNSITVRRGSKPEDFVVSKKLRYLFNFLARRTCRRGFSLEEISAGLSNDPFYAHWNEEPSKGSIKRNINRLRDELTAFYGNRFPFSGFDTISSRVKGGGGFDQEKEGSVYRFHGRVTVEHTP